MKALTIRQPWLWAILYAGKDIENRTTNWKYRGQILLHAAKGMTLEEYRFGMRYIDRALTINGVVAPDVPDYRDLEKGAILGVATIVDCVTDSDSVWFMGEYGYVLENVQILDPIPCKGNLGLWNVPLDVYDEVKAQYRRKYIND